MFKRWRDRAQRAGTITREKSNASQTNGDALSSVPVELWDMVISHLDVPDLGSLALSCHNLYNMIGPSVWQQLKKNKRERYEFLLIAHDKHYPSHTLCFNCAKFHSGAVELRQASSAARSSDWCNPSRSLKPVYPCPELAKDPKSNKYPDEFILFNSDQGHVPWWLVQQIMRANRLGSKYGMTAGVLNRTDKKSTGRIAACVNGSKAKIVNGKLLVRVTTVGQLDTRSQEPRFDDLIRNVHTCGHYYRAPALQKGCEAALRRFRDKENNVRKSSPLYRCSYCPTEAQVHIKRASECELSSARHTYGGSAPGHVMIIERYHDLGMGLYPDDDEWTGLTRSWKNAKRGATKTRAVKARFEGTDVDERTLVLGADDGDDRFALHAMMQMVQM